MLRIILIPSEFLFQLSNEGELKVVFKVVFFIKESTENLLSIRVFVTGYYPISVASSNIKEPSKLVNNMALRVLF